MADSPVRYTESMSTRMKLLRTFDTVTAISAVATVATVQAPADGAPAGPNSDDVINGRIVSINGKYEMTVWDDRSFLDTVHLHHGTIINPTGLTLAPGMRVSIFGYNAGPYFEANEIDTPYHYVPRPVRVYCGPGWWYPGFPYGYGPSYTLVVNGGTVVRRPFHSVHWAPPPFSPRVPRPYFGHR